MGCASAPVECPEPLISDGGLKAAEPPTSALLYALAGPFGDLDAAFAARTPSDLESECDLPASTREELEVSEPYDEEGALGDVKLLRYTDARACSPVRLCTFAIETPQGWWVPSADNDMLCDGWVGPSVQIYLVDGGLERIEEDVVNLHWVIGSSRMHSDAGPSGERVDTHVPSVSMRSWSCQARAEGAPLCQRHVSPAPMELDELAGEVP